MKASEFINRLEDQSFLFSCNQFKDKSHYKFVMGLGRAFPNTEAQAQFFVKQKVQLDVLNKKDVELIEQLLNKHKLSGNYKFTKSEAWVRLINHNDLYKALKLEYDF